MYRHECHPTQKVFTFSAGALLPSWLSRPSAVFLRCHARYTKNDPLVDEVELIETNPLYALIRHADGRESNVSLRHLAPAGDVPGPWIAPEDRPTLPDTEAPPEDHGTEIAPDTLSNDTVFLEAPSDTSDGATHESLTDEGLLL